MDLSASVIAYQQYYEDARELLRAGDMAGSREKFLKAAELAANISKNSTNVTVIENFKRNCQNILEFVKQRFDEKKSQTAKARSSSSDEKLENEFTPLDLTNSENKVTFDDVAGLEHVKEELKNKVIRPLQRPDIAKIYHIDAGGKILLYGPPGTGKTFIAKAIAGELGCVFYSINCGQLISSYVGESAVKINRLFKEAQEHEKVAILFDEFDSLVSKRASGDAADKERNSAVSAFLTNVDGFNPENNCKMMLLIGATNLPWDIDSAMTRGGRFQPIFVDLPDKEARLFIIKKELKNIPMEDNVDVDALADALEGYGGGDIKELCYTISRMPFSRTFEKNEICKITQEDVEKALANSRRSCSEEEYQRFIDYKKNK